MRDHVGDTITISMSDLDESGMSCDYNYTLTPTMDVSNITTSTIDTSVIDDLIAMDDITITLNEPVEFEDHMPDVSKVEDMCNNYPGLAQAYEKFKTMYSLVHQDWKGRQEENNVPPF